MTSRVPDPEDCVDLPPLRPEQRRAIAAAVIVVAVLFIVALMTFGLRGAPPGESYDDAIHQWVQDEFKQPHNSAGR